MGADDSVAPALGGATSGETSREDSGEGRVLVVDDDAAAVDCACLALTHAGFEVRAARNGAVGLETVLTFRPDVVLFDFWMPVADGRELLQGLREVSRTRIGLVAMSGTPEVESWCERVGVGEFLCKPFDLEDLRAAVRRARDHARRGSMDRISVAPGGPVSRRLRIARVALVVGREDLVRGVRSALREGDRPMQVAVVPEIEDAIRALSSFTVDVIAICGRGGSGEAESRERLAVEALKRGLPLVEGSDTATIVRSIAQVLAPTAEATGS